MKTKIELRNEIRSKLSSISHQEHLEWSKLLSKNLLYLFFQLNVIQEKKIIGAYAPIRKEPHWFLEMKGNELFGLTSYPLLENGQMFFRASSLNELELRNDFGVELKSPRRDAPRVEPEILLIPGLAFTRGGERLGRGKGFYDQFLEVYKGEKVGIGFEIQVEEFIPMEDHDIRMDYLITEKNIYKIKEY